MVKLKPEDVCLYLRFSYPTLGEGALYCSKKSKKIKGCKGCALFKPTVEIYQRDCKCQ